MQKFPLKLENRIQRRKEADSFRKLLIPAPGIDFFSNDYLGFAKSEDIFKSVLYRLSEDKLLNGATGSRLLSGNHSLYPELENVLCEFHDAEAALVYNSGYDANIGLFSSVLQKEDLIFYDELSHASIRDGLAMGHSRNYKFKHNDLKDLSKKLEKYRDTDGEVYVITESVFSMDGDSPDLQKLTEISEKFGAHLIIDEAHATGVFGKKGEGLVQKLGLQHRIFARIHTFGKALGCHGAVILGSEQLKEYLINFSRSFIYTTALPPHSVATAIKAYDTLNSEASDIKKLQLNIIHFKEEIENLELTDYFLKSDSAIQSCVISNNTRAKWIAEKLQKVGFTVKAILSPTVPKGSERLRFCLHSYNSFEEISEVLKVLSSFVTKS